MDMNSESKIVNEAESNSENKHSLDEKTIKEPENNPQNETKTQKSDGQAKSGKKSNLTTEKKSKPKPKSETERLKEQIEQLKKQLKEKDTQIQDQKSKYRYLQAEMENTRKYFIKQQDVIRLKTRADTITAFTPLIDSFEKAFETAQNQKANGHIPVESKIDNFMQGFKKLYEMLNNIFRSFHVEPIDKTGVPFDFNLHEVMMKVVNDDIPEDTVVNVIQKGYKIKDQVIQPAKVIVSKHSPPPPAPKKEESKKDVVKKSEESPKSSESKMGEFKDVDIQKKNSESEESKSNHSDEEQIS